MAWDEVSRICSDIELRSEKIEENKEATNVSYHEVLGRLGCIVPCWDGKGGQARERTRTGHSSSNQDQGPRPRSAYKYIRGTSVSGFLRVTCQGSICAMLRGAVAQL
jgi:hypothetical protein